MSEANVLPAGWVWATSGSLFDYVTSGSRGWASYYCDQGAIFLRIGNLDHDSICLDLSNIQFVNPPDGAEAKRTRVIAGDLLISVTADVGMIACVRRALGDAYINQHIALCRPSEAVFGPYLGWYLASENGGQRQFKALQRGATKAGLGLDDVKNIGIPLAPLLEQQRIVAKIEELFSDLDAGVAALRRAKANLKRYRAAVLKAAVEGDLTAEWRAQHPDTEPASQLLTRILKQRCDQWEADQLTKFQSAGKEPPKNWREKYVEPSPPDTNGLPKLPKGWCWASADQITNVITDGEHVTPPRSESGVYLLSARNILDGRLSLDDVDYVPHDVHKVLAKRLDPRPGDVLLTCSGSVGRSCVVPVGITFSLVRSVAVLRLVFEMGEFASIALRSLLLQRQINERKSQTAQANIFQGKIKKLVFPLPPHTEQHQITDEVAERLSQIEAADAAIARDLQRAGRLRQSILQQAFTGQLVPQDPTDEPASALLERLQTSRPVEAKQKPSRAKRKLP